MKSITIRLSEENKGNIEVLCDSLTTHDLIERWFAVHVKGYPFMPAYKERRWDGKIRFFSDSVMKRGLLTELIKLCKVKKIKYNIDFKINNNIPYQKFKKWVDTKLNLPFSPRDYQYKIAYDVINDFCITAQSETASGKSLSMLIITRFMLERKKRTVIIVPSIALLHQMLGDFKDYGWKDAEKYIQLIGDTFTNKDFTKPIIITTWQSLYAKRKKYYNKVAEKYIVTEKIGRFKLKLKAALHKYTTSSIVQVFKNSIKDKNDLKRLTEEIYQFENSIKEDFASIDTIIADEVDILKSDLINHLFDLCKNANYRIGLTGTMMKKEFSDWFSVVGNFGDSRIYNTYQTLQSNGQMSKFNIHVRVLNYPRQVRINFYNDYGKDYREQLYAMPLIEARNKYILHLLSQLDGNTLIIFQFKEKEGKIFKELLENNIKDTKLYYIDGDIKGREHIIKEMKNSKEKFICAGSDKTMARGINVPSLKNAIIISSFRSFSKLRQIIGRIARLSDLKGNKGRVIDIVDNMTVELSGVVRTNHAVEQYMDRKDTYKENHLKIIEKDIDMSKFY